MKHKNSGKEKEKLSGGAQGRARGLLRLQSGEMIIPMGEQRSMTSERIHAG